MSTLSMLRTLRLSAILSSTCITNYNDISVLSTYCIPHLWSPYIYCEVKDGCLSLVFEHSQFYSHLVLGCCNVSQNPGVRKPKGDLNLNDNTNSHNMNGEIS